MMRVALVLIAALQIVCAIFFVSDILFTLIGLRAAPISWQTRELLEIGAALGLVLGVVLGIAVLLKFRARTVQVEEQLKIAAGAFAQVLQERFEAWGLTPAEKDVALFLIKGMSTAEIGGLRKTSEGTIKAQTNAIYRKAGVSGRSQLLSLFIDDLMQEPLVPTA
ncbi:MAG: helix-turn-helix transcriptional regulator [Planktotalea sp.]|uniref:helix-turn-helix transcriptional regulator n=1 Tax=Planktotalea sp. TaxID=2029877 RepID=UPI003C7399AD